MRFARGLQWLALYAAALHTAQAAEAPHRRVTGAIETRDGVALRYSALLPPGRGPFPVIARTPCCTVPGCATASTSS
jgi:predicted acyl esterase